MAGYSLARSHECIVKNPTDSGNSEMTPTVSGFFLEWETGRSALKLGTQATQILGIDARIHDR